jgi:hypothetical protein
MRVVRSQNYQNITDDLSEIDQIKDRVPKISRFIKFMENRRDQSRSKRDKSNLYDTPAQKLYRKSPTIRKGNKPKPIHIVNVDNVDDSDLNISPTTTKELRC